MMRSHLLTTTYYIVFIYISKAYWPLLVRKTLYTNGMQHRRHRHTYWRCPPRRRHSPADTRP